MSEKQRLMVEMLEIVMSYIRYVEKLPLLKKLKYGSLYREAELVHNLHRCLVVPEFVDADLHWLNSQARGYVLHHRSSATPASESVVPFIEKIAKLVPEDMTPRLIWKPFF